MTAAQLIGLAGVAAALAGVQWITRNTRTQEPTPEPWHYYRAPFTGTPRAVCQTCGEIWAYWEAEDLDAHTQWHYEQGDTAE